jgi:hypothetical protein
MGVFVISFICLGKNKPEPYRKISGRCIIRKKYSLWIFAKNLLRLPSFGTLLASHVEQSLLQW